MNACFFTLLLGLTGFVTSQAQPPFLPDGGGCYDTFPWCTGQKDACGVMDVVTTLCRKTCDNCPNDEDVCKEAGCTQECSVSEDGLTATCGCFKGYQLQKDGRSCKDIDECTVNADICAEAEDPICVNTPGSYTCTKCFALPNLRDYYQSSRCCRRNAKSFRQCGFSSTIGRVSGGIPARVGRWPWMAYIQIGNIICGGSLVHRRWIVTSADCVRGHATRSIQITMGALNTTGEVVNLHEQTFRVYKVYVHPDFDFPYNDIALLRLRSPAVLSNSVGTICLPNGHEPRVGETCFATGYGVIRYGGRPAGHLLEVDLPIVDNEVCSRTYDNDSISVNSSIHMCAGHVTGGKDACQGDSGGPLVCQRCNNCDWYLAGITSFGKGCARPGQFGVYTRVEQFEEWIAARVSLTVRKRSCTRPKWHAWGGWTDCSASCDGGKRSRTRFCIQGSKGQPDCIGDLVQTVNCNTGSCEAGALAPGTWGVWREDACTTTCGEGIIRRSRVCVEANIGYPGCEFGDDTDTRPCNIRPCPTWDLYGSWSDCSATCGGGTRKSRRTCNTYGAVGATCDGEDTETERCQTQRCPRWTTYTRWSECAVTCGGAVQRRRRLCLNGNVGDIGCHVGNANEIRDCNTKPCEKWSEFGSFQSCTATCGSGVQTATRTCIGGKPGDPGCQGSPTMSQTCNEGPCIEWSEWSPCPVTCGTGKQVRHRGDQRQERDCRLRKCPEWESYGDWSQCSASCGGGRRSLTRSCNTYGAEGATCEGDATIYEPCQEQVCPTWSQWTKYRGCSRSCGGGTQERTRTCNHGEVGQLGCIGGTSHTRRCKEKPCPYWGPWNLTSCSMSCGGGTQLAERECINERVGQNGCQGTHMETRICNTGLCPTWEEYSPFSNCSASCDGGTQSATRECRNGNIGQAGCIGNHTITRKCNEQRCHVPLCCERKNLIDEATCLNFVRNNYCSTFVEYMNEHCPRACCQLINGMICLDVYPTCPLYANLCNGLNFRNTCRVTCNACPSMPRCGTN